MAIRLSLKHCHYDLILAASQVVMCSSPFVLSKACKHVQHGTMDIFKRLSGQVQKDLQWIQRHGSKQRLFKQ